MRIGQVQCSAVTLVMSALRFCYSEMKMIKRDAEVGEISFMRYEIDADFPHAMLWLSLMRNAIVVSVARPYQKSTCCCWHGIPVPVYELCTLQVKECNAN